MGLYNLHYIISSQHPNIRNDLVETRKVMSTQKQLNNHSRNMKCYKAST